MLHQASSQMPGVIGIQIQGMQDGQPAFSTMFGMPPPGQRRPPGNQPPQTGPSAGPPGDQNFATMLRDFLQTASAVSIYQHNK